MAFTQFKSLGSVLTTYDISYKDVDFIVGQSIDVPARLIEDIDFALKNTDYSLSEASICENLIYPVLKETWKSFLASTAIKTGAPKTAFPYLVGCVNK